MTLDYAQLARSFEMHDIGDPGAFRHVDHVGVAYEMLRRHDFIDATFKYARSINAIATSAGALEKFNATITVAFLSLIAERMGTTRHDGCEDFMAKNPDLLSKDVLGPWYSSARLRSELARKVFLMPDGAR